MGAQNVRMKDVDGQTRTHAQRPDGNDFTLCGFTLDGDRSCVEWEQTTDDPITCEQCWALVTFVRSIRQKKLAREKLRCAAPTPEP